MHGTSFISKATLKRTGWERASLREAVNNFRCNDSHSYTFFVAFSPPLPVTVGVVSLRPECHPKSKDFCYKESETHPTTTRLVSWVVLAAT